MKITVNNDYITYGKFPIKKLEELGITVNKLESKPFTQTYELKVPLDKGENEKDVAFSLGRLISTLQKLND